MVTYLSAALNAGDRADLVNALKVGSLFLHFIVSSIRLMILLFYVCMLELLLIEVNFDFYFVAQNKLQDLAGKHSDVLENLTPNVRKRVDVLREIQACYLFPSFILVSDHGMM